MTGGMFFKLAACAPLFSCFCKRRAIRKQPRLLVIRLGRLRHPNAHGAPAFQTLWHDRTNRVTTMKAETETI
jgi:hypothetical protein